MKTVITGQFKHETNRYSVGLSDTQAFMDRNYIFGEENIRTYFQGMENELTGFFHTLDSVEEIRIVPVMALNASPGPVVAQHIWEEVASALTAAIEAESKVDGILLALHGAMVTEKYEDGEGELLERLRQKVGPDVPIIASLDLHANVTKKMMENATALFPYDYYPHTDLYEAGIRAAACMRRTLAGEISPAMAWNKLDMIFPYVPTEHPPFRPLLEEAQSFREKAGFVDVTICHGFFASDIYEQGAAVLAVTDGDRQLAQQAADGLAEKVYAARESLVRRFYTPREAVKLAMESAEYPVVLADVADNPGSGATADSPALLRALLEAGAEDVAFAVICDPQTVAQAEAAGVGSRIRVRLGGKEAPQITGGPLECEAYVKAVNDGAYRNRDKMARGMLTELGKTALLEIGAVKVIVCSVHAQPWDLEVYRFCGIRPEDMKILAVKSAAHYRHSFGTVAKKILEVDAPALGPMDIKALPLSHSRRPIWPLD